MRLFSTYLMKANIKMTLNPNAHPARPNAAGKVRAPVPTMRLKTYVSPTCETYVTDLSECFVYELRL